ncbi:FadR/GntR family transcriptional regulator [Paractinoplanes brasiliensis]|uniref:DNA-binding FadR family transcriptional regulator n=1 Tax=Paractinoplanes brasiliensis TaxID=52695 RepID=A0A4R6JQA4_9ACTN|nr:FCD domain-containing protein [Actinoplanes brasiliensis]MDY7085289.1 FCD domain-containing protein [Actinomycetota bacterium]TDO36795.1 DNA-binding FadR family transcriptional regulator [Actinoplanes brasiliensis]GID30311.1 GntR family transcriptional regulator [Actinoplanes brasiliensis]
MMAAPDKFSFPPRRRAERLSVAVVSELVELIVTGQLAENELLPPEGPLSEHFGVSRTVIRESVKRLEEKGLLIVTQGRGTQVARSGSWNMLDPLVLSALIDNDESLGILDELTIVRGNLESAMAGAMAARRTEEELTRIEHALQVMRETRHESDSFRQADVVFHLTVMELSRNHLAENIAKRLYLHALESTRFHGMGYENAFQSTLDEHSAVVDAIARQDVAAAEQSMRHHIVTSWQRRRFEPARRQQPES